MFANDIQLARCCRALCERVRLIGMFTESGPTKQAVKLYQDNGGYLSSGETVMLMAAFAFWNSSNDKLSLGRILAVLDNSHTVALASLMAAYAGGAAEVEKWLARYGKEPSPNT